MIENRPDWVLSRQRVWGVPIPVFYTTEGARGASTPALMDKVAELLRAQTAPTPGSRSSTAELLGARARGAAARGATSSTSGSSRACRGRRCARARAGRARLVDGGGSPADRSLPRRIGSASRLVPLVASARRARRAGARPIARCSRTASCSTRSGRPYSKSDIERRRAAGEKVEFIPPDGGHQAAGRGASAHVDGAGRLPQRHHVLARAPRRSSASRTASCATRCASSSATCYDFDPTQRHRSRSSTDLLDRYLYGARRRSRGARQGAPTTRSSCTSSCARSSTSARVDLSSLYLDVRKDRLYCDPAASPERRATQTVMYRCLRVVTTALAPICCFTAEEIWSHMPKLGPYDPDSVHLALLGDGARQRRGGRGAHGAAARPARARAEGAGAVPRAEEVVARRARDDHGAERPRRAHRAHAAGLARRLSDRVADDRQARQRAAPSASPRRPAIAASAAGSGPTAPPPLCARCQAAVAARGAA